MQTDDNKLDKITKEILTKHHQILQINRFLISPLHLNVQCHNLTYFIMNCEHMDNQLIEMFSLIFNNIASSDFKFP